MRGVVEEAEVLNGGGLGEEENRVSAVSCGGGQDGAKMEASGQTSSLYGWVMWVASKSLERNAMSAKHGGTFEDNVRRPAPNSSKVRRNSSRDDKLADAVCPSSPNDLLGLSRGDGRGCRAGSGVVARGGGEAARRDMAG